MSGQRQAAMGEAAAFVQMAVAHQGDDCLPWPFAVKGNGYGVVSHGGRTWRAHRLVLTLAQGPAPVDGMDAAHAPVICHNRLCVNPAHLRWATRRENVADMGIDGTADHMGRARLTESQVLAIRADARPHREVARAYGIGFQTVRHIRARRTWRHL